MFTSATFRIWFFVKNGCNENINMLPFLCECFDHYMQYLQSTPRIVYLVHGGIYFQLIVTPGTIKEKTFHTQNNSNTLMHCKFLTSIVYSGWNSIEGKGVNIIKPGSKKLGVLLYHVIKGSKDAHVIICLIYWHHVAFIH